MPRIQKDLLPFLLPAVIVLPLACLLLVLAVGQWEAHDRYDAAVARTTAVAAAVGGQLEAAVERQEDATDLLSRSPVVWLWVKFQGELLSASNRSHAQMALEEVRNYSQLLSGATLYMASERTHTLYRDGAAVAGLSRSQPDDAWYFTALQSQSPVVACDARQVRTSARIMQGTSLLGAITCVSGSATLAASALASIPAESSGLLAVLADAAGTVVYAAGGTAGGQASVFDLYAGTPRDSILSAIQASSKLGGKATPAVFSAGGRSLPTAVALVPASGWYLFVSQETRTAMATERITVLIAVALAALALLVIALAWIASARIASFTSQNQTLQLEREAAMAEARGLSMAARRILESAAAVSTASQAFSREAAAAAGSAEDAIAAFATAEDRDGELRSGIASRLPLLTRLTAAARQAVERSRAIALSAQSIARNAARGEEELNRAIAAGAAAAQAMQNAARDGKAAGEAAERLKLLSLNVALEAGRSAGTALPRMANLIGDQAADVAVRTRSLAERLAQAGDGAREVGHAAQEAGRMVHDAVAASAEIDRLVREEWEPAEGLLARVEASALNAQELGEAAAVADRGRSAMEGITRSLARAGALAAEIRGLGERITDDAATMAKASQAPAASRGRRSGPGLSEIS